MTDTTPLTFVDPMKRETIVNFGGTIPTMATPKNGSSSLEVLYKTPKGFIQQSSTLMAPPLSTYYGKIQKGAIPLPPQPPPDPTSLPAQVSNGGTYIAPSGATVQVPPNVAVPADWSPTTVVITDGVANNIIVAPDTSAASVQQIQQNIDTVGSAYVSDGGYYQTPSGGSVVLVPAGNPIPQTWVSVTNYITDDQKENAIVAPADIPKTQTTPIMDAVGKILAIAGVGVIGYTGYLFVYKPAELRAYIEQLKTIKELAVDSAYLAGAIAFLVGISFVSYEFMVSYEKTGTIGGAIGDMLAESLEFLAGVLIDTFEQLAKDLWNWIKKELSELWDAINPF